MSLISLLCIALAQYTILKLTIINQGLQSILYGLWRKKFYIKMMQGEH